MKILDMQSEVLLIHRLLHSLYGFAYKVPGLGNSFSKTLLDLSPIFRPVELSFKKSVYAISYCCLFKICLYRSRCPFH